MKKGLGRKKMVLWKREERDDVLLRNESCVLKDFASQGKGANNNAKLPRKDFHSNLVLYFSTNKLSIQI